MVLHFVFVLVNCLMIAALCHEVIVLHTGLILCYKFRDEGRG